jgi:hypothetical protein
MSCSLAWKREGYGREMRKNHLEELMSVEDLAHRFNRRLRGNWSVGVIAMPPDVVACISEEALHDYALDGFCPRPRGTSDEGPDFMTVASVQALLLHTAQL